MLKCLWFCEFQSVEQNTGKVTTRIAECIIIQYTTTVHVFTDKLTGLLFFLLHNLESIQEVKSILYADLLSLFVLFSNFLSTVPFLQGVFSNFMHSYQMKITLSSTWSTLSF